MPDNDIYSIRIQITTMIKQSAQQSKAQQYSQS